MLIGYGLKELLFLLNQVSPEGVQKLKVLETVGQWRNIELSDGRQGWMQSSDLEII